MSLNRYKNPVKNYFIYNDEIRKSTCKVCYFDMAGRHSENLMRHLKRKHPSTYAEVMLEKQRRRSTANSIQSGAETDPLSSMFKFETEPHKLVIKSRNHFDSRDYKCDDSVNDQAEQAEEEEANQSAGQLHDFNESISYQDDGSNANQFVITCLPEPLQQQQQQQQHQQIPVSPGSNPASTSAPIGHPIGDGMSQVANDDASLLQLLGYKFNKYTPSTKYTVQYHINRILYKADMGCYDNADASRLPDSDL
ncbi:GH24249 [Drosophila grimshawi]|uniref:GH24249 n=1 Tax=Drosophila grimshawi TaxID=7222 RepID=B4JMX1_DROGR|nr:GH24249 [Drosophila grimshawi]